MPKCPYCGRRFRTQGSPATHHQSPRSLAKFGLSLKAFIVCPVGNSVGGSNVV